VESGNRAIQSINRRSSPLVIDHSVALQKSGLIISGSISFRRWELAGHQLVSFAESTAWWLADWLVYGENSFQERYREAVERTSLSYQTLRNYTWVARRFDLSRRRENLSFGHHAEVAALDPPEQDYWLRKAEELGWSRNRLRNNVRASLKEREFEEAPNLPTATERESADARRPGVKDRGIGRGDNKLTLRLSVEQVEQFALVAGEQGLSVDEWVVQVLETAVSGKAR
jgi:hypothetical protein